MKYTLYKAEKGDFMLGYMLGRKRLIGREEFWSGACWWRDKIHINRHCIRDRKNTIESVKELINEQGELPNRQAMVVSDNLNDILNYLEKGLV